MSKMHYLYAFLKRQEILIGDCIVLNIKLNGYCG